MRMFGNIIFLFVKGNDNKIAYYAKFEDTKGIIRSRKSKERQHNEQKNKDFLGFRMIFKVPLNQIFSNFNTMLYTIKYR